MNTTSATRETDKDYEQRGQDDQKAAIERNVPALGWVAFFDGLAQDMIQIGPEDATPGASY